MGKDNYMWCCIPFTISILRNLQFVRSEMVTSSNFGFRQRDLVVTELHIRENLPKEVPSAAVCMQTRYMLQHTSFPRNSFLI